MSRPGTAEAITQGCTCTPILSSDGSRQGWCVDGCQLHGWAPPPKIEPAEALQRLMIAVLEAKQKDPEASIADAVFSAGEKYRAETVEVTRIP